MFEIDEKQSYSAASVRSQMMTPPRHSLPSDPARK